MLSKRLKRVYDFIPLNNIVVDVGCDHGYLAIELIKSNKSPLVIATDNKKGPLAKAKSNIALEGIDNRIKLVLTNGLNNVVDEFDVLTISGMGVYNIINIVESSIEKLNDKIIIVQINKDPITFREWLLSKKFRILDEDIICDTHHYHYFVFKTDNSNDKYSLDEVLFGKFNLHRMSHDFSSYLELEYLKLSMIDKKFLSNKQLSYLNSLNKLIY